MSPRGTSDILTRTTAIIATLFIITSITLTILSFRDNGGLSIMDNEGSNVSIAPLDLPELPQLD